VRISAGTWTWIASVQYDDGWVKKKVGLSAAGNPTTFQCILVQNFSIARLKVAHLEQFILFVVTITLGLREIDRGDGGQIACLSWKQTDSTYPHDGSPREWGFYLTIDLLVGSKKYQV
jgi:hypothetical protein